MVGEPKNEVASHSAMAGTSTSKSLYNYAKCLHTHTHSTHNKHEAPNATMLGVSDFKVNTITCSINEICTLTTPTVKTLAEGTTTGTLQSGQGKRALTILVDISWEFDVPVLKEKQKSF